MSDHATAPATPPVHTGLSARMAAIWEEALGWGVTDAGASLLDLGGSRLCSPEGPRPDEVRAFLRPGADPTRLSPRRVPPSRRHSHARHPNSPSVTRPVCGMRLVCPY